MVDAAEIFHFWTPLAVLVMLLLAWRHWHDRQAGLLFTYLVSFASIYLLGPFTRLLPWYDMPGAEDTAVGLQVSVAALVALAVGAEVMLRWLRSRHVEMDAVAQKPVAHRLVNIYLIAGTLLFFFVMPIIGRVASLTSLVSTGATLVVVGFCLKCWNAWVDGEGRRFGLWLLATLLFPISTILAQGFLGYGLTAAATIVLFAASFYRPRWKLLVFGMLLSYVSLSVYVTYMRDRRDIRASVWGGESFERRLERLKTTAMTPEVFDIGNPAHLERVEDRLNQGALIGLSVSYMSTNHVPFLHGSTFISALIAPIPRAVWPDKPVIAGSGDLVSNVTGLIFSESTSVGVGHVLEAYINFGMAGVVATFFVIGGVLVLVDSVAYRYLHQGNGNSFVLWYLPGLGLLQIGGSLSEATGFAAASWAMASMLNIVAGYKRRAKGGTGLSGVRPLSADREGML